MHLCFWCSCLCFGQKLFTEALDCFTPRVLPMLRKGARPRNDRNLGILLLTTYYHYSLLPPYPILPTAVSVLQVRTDTSFWWIQEAEIYRVPEEGDTGVFYWFYRAGFLVVRRNRSWPTETSEWRTLSKWQKTKNYLLWLRNTVGSLPRWDMRDFSVFSFLDISPF